MHNEAAEEPNLAFLLSRMVCPTFPEVFGVLRAVERPTYEEQVRQQNEHLIKAKGVGKLDKLFASDDMWTVSN